METLTVKEYATLRGISISAVYNAIRANFKMDGVLSHKKTGGTLLLYVDKNLMQNILK